jgi:rubrerythrin
MNKLLPPRDLIEAMGESYELLLESALKKAHQSNTAVHEVIDECRDEVVAIKKLGGDEVTKLENYLKRDLIDAAQYKDKTGKDLKFWLGFDIALVKQKFWGLFSEAADQTTVALNQLKVPAESAKYHSGEVVGLGVLVCDQCGEELHFHKPTLIPHCPKCGQTHFHRQNSQ